MGLRLPNRVWFIATTEACERFSYYGMLSILTLYLTREMKLEEATAKESVHLFKMAVYFLPLLGGWIADQWLGRYRTIFSLSLFYCLGHASLAIFEGSKAGLILGMGLIALGAGGVKPCVSAFIGDQFKSSESHLLEKVYGLFYWAINLGALFAFACVPLIRDHWGYSWAFGVPGIFMGLATLVFWMGSRTYIKVPPAAAQPKKDALPGERIRNLKLLGKIALVLAPAPVFWALFDQINTSWVLQGTKMVPFEVLGYKVDAERIQSVSALYVLIWVPVLSILIYPAIEKCGVRLTALRRMGAGMVFAAAAFVICAYVQHRIDGGGQVSLAWQLLPYAILGMGEVMLSASGLEFAYLHAPAALKSVVMSFWLLTISLGNFLVAAITNLNTRFVGAKGTTEFLFYAALMVLVTVVFSWLAARQHFNDPAGPQGESSGGTVPGKDPSCCGTAS